MRLSGPYAHDNLSIFFIHGDSAPGPVPLTLQEAMDAGVVSVRETGSVNELTIENTGDQSVFIQAGDIVKGGRQDRVLQASLVLPPKSGETPIGSFCVEQGRWSRRGDENVAQFASSKSALPSKEAKLALRAPQRAKAEYADTGARQSEVWKKVAEIQDDLSAHVGEAVAAAASPSSLQLALESEKLDASREAFIASLKEKGLVGEDVIGQVVVINGEPNSADVYPSNGLFRKMWPKNLDAAATEAISLKSGGAAAAAPGEEAILGFLAEPAAPGVEQAAVPGVARLMTKDKEKAFLFDAETDDGKLVHRNVVAK